MRVATSRDMHEAPVVQHMPKNRLRTVLARAAHHLADSAGVIPQKRTDVVHSAGVDLPAVFARVVLGEFRGRHAQERVDATLTGKRKGKTKNGKQRLASFA